MRQANREVNSLETKASYWALSTALIDHRVKLLL